MERVRLGFSWVNAMWQVQNINRIIEMKNFSFIKSENFELN